MTVVLSGDQRAKFLCVNKSFAIQAVRFRAWLDAWQHQFANFGRLSRILMIWNLIECLTRFKRYWYLFHWKISNGQVAVVKNQRLLAWEGNHQSVVKRFWVPTSCVRIATVVPIQCHHRHAFQPPALSEVGSFVPRHRARGTEITFDNGFPDDDRRLSMSCNRGWNRRLELQI